MAEEQKKGWFTRLFGAQKKGGCCSSYRIEEIPKADDQDGTSEQGATKNGGSCCCGPAPKAESSSINDEGK